MAGDGMRRTYTFHDAGLVRIIAESITAGLGLAAKCGAKGRLPKPREIAELAFKVKDQIDEAMAAERREVSLVTPDGRPVPTQ